MKKSYLAESRASSPKRSEIWRLSRSRKQRKLVRSSLLRAEAVAEIENAGEHDAGDGVVRMKILVKKKDLKQMLEAIRASDDHDHDHGNSNINNISRPHNQPPFPSSSDSLSSVEQRLNFLRKKHLLRARGIKETARTRRCSWIPALQSIPEEF